MRDVYDRARRNDSPAGPACWPEVRRPARLDAWRLNSTPPSRTSAHQLFSGTGRGTLDCLAQGVLTPWARRRCASASSIGPRVFSASSRPPSPRSLRPARPLRLGQVDRAHRSCRAGPNTQTKDGRNSSYSPGASFNCDIYICQLSVWCFGPAVN